MSQKWILALAAALVVIAALWWYMHTSTQAPASSATEEMATSTATTTPISQPQQTPQAPAATSASPFTLQLVAGDKVASWSFAGAYTGNTDLTQKANTEIVRLKGLLGSKQFTDYDLYVSIANQYDLLGDGTQEFAYLKKALTIDSTTTGLAWENAGQLLSRLGAYGTARVSFERAILAQPTLQYHQGYLDFLNAHYSGDTVTIQKEQKIIQSAQTTTQ